MAKIAGLIRRGRTYYLRVRVPKDVQSHFKLDEIVRSLQTRNYDDAVKRILVARVGIEAEFEKARKVKKAQETTEDMLASYDEHELAGLVMKWFKDLKANSHKHRVADSNDWTAERLHDYRIELAQEELFAREEVLGISQRENHAGMTAASRFLKAEGISYSRGSAQYRQLGHLFSRAIHDLAQESLRELQGKLHISNFASIGGNSGILPTKVISMNNLCKEYLKDPAKKRGRSTIKNYNVIQRAIQEVIGNETPAHQVTRDQCKEVRDLIIQLPSNALKKTKGKSLKQAVLHAAKKNLPRSSPATINMHLQKLSAIFNYAYKEGYIPRNPAEGLKVQEQMKKRVKRLPFDVEQLQKIFAAPLYTGCVDGQRGYSQVGNAKPRGARFWVPLISLWTGMRLNEICQLHITDITKKDGVSIILIQPDDSPVDSADIEKRIKTEAGIRFVPIHPELQKLGLLEFVEKRKASGHKRLFFELPLGAHQDYAHGFSQWFGRFLENCDAKKPRTSFHSLRHNYRDALREAALPYDATLQLGGWSGKTTDAIYGGVNMKPKTLYDHICKVSYPELDLSHL